MTVQEYLRVHLSEISEHLGPVESAARDVIEATAEDGISASPTLISAVQHLSLMLRRHRPAYASELRQKAIT